MPAVIVYWIRALFLFDKKELGPLVNQVKPIPLASALQGLGVQLDKSKLKITGDVLDFGTVVCATLGNPPLHLGAPVLAAPYSPLATPPSTVGPEAWLPRAPPPMATPPAGAALFLQNPDPLAPALTRDFIPMPPSQRREVLVAPSRARPHVSTRSKCKPRS